MLYQHAYSSKAEKQMALILWNSDLQLVTCNKFHRYRFGCRSAAPSSSVVAAFSVVKA